jgi:hypothetical protein
MRVVYLSVTSGEAPKPSDNCVFLQLVVLLYRCQERISC